MGHRTGVRVYELNPEYIYHRDELIDGEWHIKDPTATGSMKADLLFEFVPPQDSYLQVQLDGECVEYQTTPLRIHRQPPVHVKGLTVNDIATCGGVWEWGWCLPSELTKLWIRGDLNDWVHGLLRVASTLCDQRHLIELYDAG